MDNNCLFCKIINGEIPANKLFEDDDLLAFHDINPEAPLHFLVIPKKHISGPADVGETDQQLIGKLMQKGAQLAEENGFTDFRFAVNNGAKAGQTVFHFHLHVLAGRDLTWPPG
jgi:histidine triad (HIT) family protein